MNVKVQRFDGTKENVWKYVFEFGENAIAEAVLYSYNNFYERTVLCVSVQSGCPVGCAFCGTGKRFVRNLTMEEIIYQVDYIIKEDMKIEFEKVKLFQIMFMSMGEPMLNIKNVSKTLQSLNKSYPTAKLLLSTVGIDNGDTLLEVLKLGDTIENMGLQFSIHEAFDEKRDLLIPFKNKMNLRQIRDAGLLWYEYTHRPVFLNFCINGNNASTEEINRLKDLFPPIIFNFTFSVVCSADETMKDAGYREMTEIERVQQNFLESGYNVKIFDPAGQDDIGGGCGQLWYVQKWLKERIIIA